MKHDFTFVHWNDDGVAVYTCKECGSKADSKTIYVMDREHDCKNKKLDLRN